MASPEEPIASGGDLEAARGFIGRLSLLAAAQRGEAQADPQTLADGLAVGLRHRLQVSGAPLTILVSDRGFTVGDVDLGMHDLVSTQLAHAFRSQGLRRLRVSPHARHEDLVVLGHLLAQDWANHAAPAPPLDAALWALDLDAAQADFDPPATVTALDLRVVTSAERMARVAAQLGLPAPDPAAAAWFDAGPGSPPPPPLPLPEAPPRLAALQGLVEAAATQLRAAVAAGAPAEALAWLGGLGALIEGDLPVSEARRAALRGAFTAALDGAGSLLGPSLRAGLEAAPKEEAWAGAIFALTALQVQVVDEPGLDRSVEQAAGLPAGPLQQAAADALAIALGAAPLLMRLKTASTPLLPLLLRALRRHADSTMVVQLSARLNHEAPEVRAAALVAVREQRGPRLTELVVHAIHDPALPVRLEALRYLSAHRLREAAPQVLERLQSAAEAEELRALALTYAMVTSGQGIPELLTVATGGQLRGRAAMQGLLACGAAGRAALDQLGRRWPELRPDLREVLGASR